MTYQTRFVSRFANKQVLITTPARDCLAWSAEELARRVAFVKAVAAASTCAW